MTAEAPASSGTGLRVALFAQASSANVTAWCGALAEAGLEVTLISFERPSGLAAGVSFEPIVARGPGRARYVMAAPTVRRLVRRLRPDVVIGYFVTGYGTLASLSGAKPVVLVAVGSDLLAPAGPVVAGIRRIVVRRADLVVAVADHLARRAGELGARAERVEVIPHGVPVPPYLAAQRQAELPVPPLRVISTRSLHALYRTDTLILGVAAAREAGHEIELTVVGDGPERAALEALAARVVPEEAVCFAGRARAEEIPQLLADHHVYAAAAPFDGVSASLLEAIVVGLVPVVPDNDANRPWITDGVDGLLVAGDDADAFAAAFVVVAGDDGLRRRAWQRAREEIPVEFDASANAVRVEGFLRALSAPSPRTGS